MFNISKAVQIMRHNRRPFVAELGDGEFFKERKTIVLQFGTREVGL